MSSVFLRMSILGVASARSTSISNSCMTSLCLSFSSCDTTAKAFRRYHLPYASQCAATSRTTKNIQLSASRGGDTVDFDKARMSPTVALHVNEVTLH